MQMHLRHDLVLRYFSSLQPSGHFSDVLMKSHQRTHSNTSITSLYLSAPLASLPSPFPSQSGTQNLPAPTLPP